MSSVTEENPQALANYRFARGAVIILGILILIAIVALILGFVLRQPNKAAIMEGNGDARHLSLAPGTHVVSMDVEPGRLILRTRSSAGEEIDIIDTGTAGLVGQIKVPSSEPSPK